MGTHEARNATTSGWTEIPTVTSEEADRNTAFHNASANWNIYATTVNTTSISTLLSYLSQSTHSPSTETNSSSDIIAETKKEVTTVPAESFFSKSVHQATVNDSKTTTSAITSNLITQVSTSIPLISSKFLLSISSNQLPGDRYTIPDDVLVISGGLYDAPRIYNQNMVYEDDELQNDHLPFNAQPGHLRLKFLPGEKEQDLFSTYETFQIPPGDL
ncbi:hypothetical protein JD844_018540 [Phrynosoma platyrhinos]|uniref:Uncharacterized protein n=1 Tax=Phrynosoma platyrhinos TaxID=52577 RepID=A0ABQ7SNP4_PHRPL|nr:hypothetical protein JD844_018540 [Phrynosoma platyrhinos]